MNNPFKTKRLSDILESFDKTLTDLDTLVTNNEKQKSDNEAAIAALNQENAELVSETESANKVASNIKNLLGR